MNVIFVDVDGVLNRGHGWPVAELVDLFNQTARKSNANVVISSSWRIVRRATDVHNILKIKSILTNVIGETPIISEQHSDKGEIVRVKEIRQWLKDNPVRNFAVIDDLKLDIENLFQTREDIGITRRISKSMIAHFGGHHKDVEDEFDDARNKGWI